jgi:hypothetical protein
MDTNARIKVVPLSWNAGLLIIKPKLFLRKDLLDESKRILRKSDKSVEELLSV